MTIPPVPMPQKVSYSFTLHEVAMEAEKLINAVQAVRAEWARELIVGGNIPLVNCAFVVALNILAQTVVEPISQYMESTPDLMEKLRLAMKQFEWDDEPKEEETLPVVPRGADA